MSGQEEEPNSILGHCVSIQATMESLIIFPTTSMAHFLGKFPVGDSTSLSKKLTRYFAEAI